mmetsp:Transcript_5159/g.16463  ORF Transcript_5159/g.16463 Transcript_5159/m.16463 type:complete len:234 (-) Transcript_5159:95-796(-)
MNRDRTKAKPARKSKIGRRVDREIDGKGIRIHEKLEGTSNRRITQRHVRRILAMDKCKKWVSKPDHNEKVSEQPQRTKKVVQPRLARRRTWKHESIARTADQTRDDPHEILLLVLPDTPKRHLRQLAVVVFKGDVVLVCLKSLRAENHFIVYPFLTLVSMSSVRRHIAAIGALLVCRDLACSICWLRLHFVPVQSLKLIEAGVHTTQTHKLVMGPLFGLASIALPSMQHTPRL